MERGTVTIVDVRPEKDYEKVGTELRSPPTGSLCGAATLSVYTPSCSTAGPHAHVRCSLASGTCSLRLA